LDLEKLKLNIYDFLGIILPGFIAITEGWTLLRGWHDAINSITHLGGTQLSLLLVCAFGSGHLVQELGDLLVHLLGGPSYLRRGREELWRSEEAGLVKQTIKRELGHDILSVDYAYDYCLTRLKDRFERREVFIATSDLCRSLVVLSLIALMPICRIAFYDVTPMSKSLMVVGIGLAILAVVGALAWRRMNRYRRLSEVTVFRAFLGLDHDHVAVSATSK